ncbi:NAD(P)-binding domain-containing protein [Bradyrhizobium sp. AUGA SZCCT0240]|uniref:NAD(P)-binding domain-containing protein n=1 Tax=unclassified Bradyrhizobium TaxID=2631580 RepID=UPI001BA61E3B|nr:MULTISPECIES: NAD(P)-binding domain-containing protein [unclassified Bradyrhizobium]MBR1197201.1 NAD(P)-binding domain-containing protein [Bradyrhizobium sp. AUGA SZCCT0158]MBR1239993.1 NAD(P)-binding domain-containing protein [Bradyrhizobium sp. AUGA SZCCT0274]MBR1254110.1 NAD(P)-binding domain-containing protein [Bradyrhizobium sp. AUGA SZCCT0240]
MPIERIDTLVIGGGQAGLVMSYRLKQRGIMHLVLERARIAERWRSERWDGLKFQFPNWSVRLPDFAFPHSDPDAFATSGEIVTFIDAFAEFIAPPIRCGVEVTRLKRGNAGFIAECTDGTIEASNVVIATGPYQQPLVPDLLRDHPVFQVHASAYRNPGQLPPGAVLVVGAGASGAQIADELHRAGRRVFLAVGQHTRMPRRYRGQDLTWWFGALRLFDMTAEQRGPIRVNPSITGAYGGYTIDFRKFAADGITLLGRVLAARDGVLEIAPGLAESLATGDAYYAGFLDMLDAHVEQHGLHLPADPAARNVLADPPSVTEPVRRLDLGKEDIHAVVWATGYGVDFSWIDLPVRDHSGEPVHRGGVSEVPGLYFLGLPYLSKLYSAFLSGVGDDAAVLADHIAARR